MKKFINRVDDLLVESLSGFATAHRDLVNLHLDPNYLTRAQKPQNKVALISGGGSGHEPLHTGFIGYGMLDAACPGHVFTSPTPDQMLAAAEAVGQAGAYCSSSRTMPATSNFEMAAEMLPFDNATVITSDDVAVENSTYTTGRRGVAGTVIVEKCVGSLAETGADLATCKALGDKVNRRTASMGVALSSCTVPAAGRPTFELATHELEMGVGIHGESGRRREAMRSADEIVADLVHAILEDLKPAAGSEVLLMVNGFTGTPLMELYVLYNAAAKLLEQRGLVIKRSLVGDYTTSLEMAGASITVCLLDKEILQHWDSPVHTAALRWGR